MIRVLCLLFVLSGAAGLIYESIWTRYLGLFVGHDAYAQIVVLVIFLGGMSAGAMVVSRWGHRVRNPLLAYALVEFAVGCIGLMFHDVFVWSTNLAYGTLYPALAGSAALPLAKWALASALILPQSILLGATFPLMSAGVLRLNPSRPGRSLALLYFSNSLGAAGGVLLAGFYLVSLAGLPGTLVTAAMLNLGVGVLAIGVGVRSRAADRAGRRGSSAPERHTAHRRGPPPRPPDARRRVRDCRGIVRLRDRLDPDALAGAGQRHPFVRAHALRVHPRHRTRRVLDPRARGRIGGPGTHAGHRAVGHGEPGARHPPALCGSFGWVASLLATFARSDQGYAGFTIARYAICLAIMLPATFCAGMTLPLLTRTLVGAGFGERAIGAVYGWNTLGSIVGVGLGGLVLLPLIGLQGMLLAAADWTWPSDSCSSAAVPGERMAGAA